MKILVTGGSGFIGSNFILYWMTKYPSDYVVNVDKLTYAGNPENLVSVENNPKYTFIREDICNQKVMLRIMRGIDIVVHFAAESHVDRSILQPDTFIQTNIVGTHTLLKAALEAKISRFHHVSTDEVFGSLTLESREKFNENTPYNPKSP
jgi:dTDP-glucose 4,6-dehydratase